MKVHAGVLHAMRRLCTGMTNDAILQTLMEEMLAKYGIEPS